MKDIPDFMLFLENGEAVLAIAESGKFVIRGLYSASPLQRLSIPPAGGRGLNRAMGEVTVNCD